MTKIVLKTIDNVVYTGELISKSNVILSIRNVEADNVKDNERLQKAKDINIGMEFFIDKVIWYTTQYEK